MLGRYALGTLLVVAAALARGGPVDAAESLAARIGSAAAARQSKALRASIGVWDAKSGELLCETNGSVRRRPASVMKLATTAAALGTLGPRAELATEIGITASPDGEGVVAGDLIVRGGGDPGINNRSGPGVAEATLRALAHSVRAAGVARVAGNLVLDDTAFTGPMRHPGWDWSDGEWAWFKAPVSSLLLTDACVELTVLPGASDGAPATVRTDPPTSAVRFLDRIVTAASGARKTNVVLGRSDAGSIPITGSIPAGSQGFRTDAACVDPAEHLGDVFLRVLRDEGVAVAGRVLVRRDPSAEVRNVTADSVPFTLLARHATSVLDTVRIANKHSQNLYAELLLRAVGRDAGDGSFEGGCRATRRALGFAPEDASFVQVDGSGLARENQVTVGAIGRILVRSYGSDIASDFIASLPAGGETDSTLKRRFEGAKYEGRVYAKTGTLRDTSALAGYVRSPGGRTFAFAVLCEGDVSRGRELQDDVVDVLVSQ